MTDKEFLSAWTLYKSTPKRLYDTVIGYGIPGPAETIRICAVNMQSIGILSYGEFLRWLQLTNTTAQPPIDGYDSDDARADARLQEYDNKRRQLETTAAIVELLHKLADKI